MTTDELDALPVAVPLETAARAIDIGRDRAYQMARDGAFPVRILPGAVDGSGSAIRPARLPGCRPAGGVVSADLEPSQPPDSPPTCPRSPGTSWSPSGGRWHP